MMILFVIFVFTSLVLIPVAYVVGIIDKLKTLSTQQTMFDKVKNNFVFIPLGLPILGLDLLADIVYFWKYNFQAKDNLKQIIIPKDKSIITHKSIREIINSCIKYNDHKIKTVNTSTIVKNFSKQLVVIQNIQFLLFGQIVPLGGFTDDNDGVNKGYTLKTLKTQELEEQRNLELKSLDDSEQLMKS